MKGSLRIMHFGFLITVMVAVLIIGISRDATAQGNDVECPCDFEGIPKTAGCWVEPFDFMEPIDPRYFTEDSQERCELINSDIGDGFPKIAVLAMGVVAVTGVCFLERFLNVPPECTPQGNVLISLTHKQVKACQCELLAYTTALNEVEGISVSGGPPYACFDVDCRQKVLAPIPTLNEYGMIITAGVLGLLAVIGLFVMRRRKVTA